MKLLTKQKETHTLREQANGCQVDGTVREFRMGTFTRLYLKWMICKDQLYSTCNSARGYVAAWMGGGFGANEYIYIAQSRLTLCDPKDTRLLRPWDFLGKSTGVGCHFLLQYVWLSSPKTTRTLLIVYTPIPRKKFKRKKDKEKKMYFFPI